MEFYDGEDVKIYSLKGAKELRSPYIKGKLLGNLKIGMSVIVVNNHPLSDESYNHPTENPTHRMLKTTPLKEVIKTIDGNGVVLRTLSGSEYFLEKINEWWGIRDDLECYYVNDWTGKHKKKFNDSRPEKRCYHNKVIEIVNSDAGIIKDAK